ncbi:hypothetical protein [Amycolatopsis japonica]|nr:hypothetical protein [Amycolatopsis japonica]
MIQSRYVAVVLGQEVAGVDEEQLSADRGGEDERPIGFDAAHVAGRSGKGESSAGIDHVPP